MKIITLNAVVEEQLQCDKEFTRLYYRELLINQIVKILLNARAANL